MLALGRQRAGGCRHVLCVASVALVLLGQELHGIVDAVQFTSVRLEIARVLGPVGHHQHVIVVQQALHRDVDADLEVAAEDHTLALHLPDPPVDEVLFHLEVGNAVTQQAARTIRLFEHGGDMTGAGQLLRARQSRRAGAHDGNPLARASRRGLRGNPALVPSTVDDLAFDRLDRHRIVLDVQSTRRLAGGGADAAGEFREIVGGLQVIQRLAPLVAINQGVEIRDLVVHRAALVTERNPAIHAARGLLLQLGLRQRLDEFFPGLQAFGHGVVPAVMALDLQEAGGLAHVVPLRLVLFGRDGGGCRALVGHVGERAAVILWHHLDE